MNTKKLVLALFAASTLAPLAAFSQPAADEKASVAPRSITTRSAEGYSRHRDAKLSDSSTLSESTFFPTTMRRQLKGGSQSQLLTDETAEAWFYDAEVETYFDVDNDGYDHYVNVRFDVDSVYANHWIFARLFLSSDGEYWEEYHVTDDILITGSTSDDDYTVETELVTGFAPGYYDLLIEIYDADFDYFLAEYGPNQSAAFALLPLEDLEYDQEPRVIVTEHGGGSMDWIVVAGLALLLIFARLGQTGRIRARIRVQRSSRKRLAARRGSREERQ